MEYDLVASPARPGYRTNDALSPSRRLYSMLLQETYTNQNVIIEDNEIAMGSFQLKLLGTTNFSLLGSSRLAIL